MSFKKGDNYKKWYLTDIINEEEYKKWKKGDLIFIFSNTGSGKTTFVLDKLSLSYFEKNKSVLYLVPRIILKEQIEEDIRKVLDKYPDKASEYNQKFKVWTYQQLENAILNNCYEIIPLHDLLICDECHYFITDSIFNRNTQVSYNFIFRNLEYYNQEIVTLALTATPNNLISYMEKDIFYKSMSQKQYNNSLENLFYPNMPYDYSDKELSNSKMSIFKDKKIGYIYNQDEEKKFYDIGDIFYPSKQLEHEKFCFNANSFNIKIYKLSKDYNYIDIQYLINENEIISLVKKTKDKSIIFVSNKSKGKALEKVLLENKVSVVYIDSENKNKEKKQNVQQLKQTKTFSQNVFITTSVLDVGVNFFDKNIKNVVIAHTEPVELLQMLGRIRVQDIGQKVSLFIFQRSARYFQNLLKENIVKKIQCYEYLEKRKYGKDNRDKNNDFKNGDNVESVLYEHFKPNNDLPDGYEDFLYLSQECSHRYTIKLNTLAPYYLRQLHTFYEDINDKMTKKDKNYFIKKQLELLGHENNFSNKNFYCIKCLQNEIENKSRKIKDGIMQDECKNILSEFKPLVRMMNKNLVRSNENLSIKVFNRFCKEYDIPYCIAQKENVRIKKTIYYLVKLDDNINKLNFEIQL